jgi:eukaryotic-like serine/threonine-protein kinase
MLLLEKKPAEAELKLRESLTIRRKIQSDDWTTFDTESMLGETLGDQKKYSEAEPLLLSGYEGLKRRETSIPPQEAPRLTRAVERLVKFYDAWGQKDKAAKWRELQPAATAQPKT